MDRSELVGIGVMGLLFSLVLLSGVLSQTAPINSVDPTKVYLCAENSVEMECATLSPDSKYCNKKYLCKTGWAKHTYKEGEDLTISFVEKNMGLVENEFTPGGSKEYIRYRKGGYDYTITLYESGKVIGGTFVEDKDDISVKFGASSGLVGVNRYTYVLTGDMSSVFLPKGQEWIPSIRHEVGHRLWTELAFDFSDVCEQINISGSGMNSSCEVTKYDDRVEIDFWSASLVDPEISYQNVTGCDNLSTANTYYTLNASVTNSGKTVCMNITADNVTLDLNGFTIDGVSGADSVGVLATGDNVTVVNGTIDEWVTSVKLDDSDYSTVKNLSLEGTTSGNYWYGVWVIDSSNSNITNNTFKTGDISQKYQFGLYLTGTHDLSPYLEFHRNTMIMYKCQFIRFGVVLDYANIYKNQFIGGGSYPDSGSDYSPIQIYTSTGNAHFQLYENNMTNVRLVGVVQAPIRIAHAYDGSSVHDNYFGFYALGGGYARMWLSGATSSPYHIRLENNTFNLTGSGGYRSTPISESGPTILRNNTFYFLNTGNNYIGCDGDKSVFQATDSSVDYIIAEYNTFHMNGFTCLGYFYRNQPNIIRNNTFTGSVHTRVLYVRYPATTQIYGNNMSEMDVPSSEYFYGYSGLGEANTSVGGEGRGNIYNVTFLNVLKLKDTDGDGWIDAGDDYPLVSKMTNYADYGPYDNRGDSTPPTVEWNVGIFTEINSTIEYAAVNISVNTSEWAWCNVTIDGTKYAMTPDAEQDFHYYEATLAEQNNTISVSCIDGSYNNGSATDAWVEYNVPVLYIDWNWTDINSTVCRSWTYVCVNLSEDEDNICTMWFNGSEEVSLDHGSNICWNQTPLSGNYTSVVVNCTNGGLTANTTYAWINADVTAPTVGWDWSYIDSSNTLTKSNVTIDTGADTAACRLDIDGTNYTMVKIDSQHYYYEWTIPEGTHNYTLKAYCNDSCNNTGSSADGWYRSKYLCTAYSTPGEYVKLAADILNYEATCMNITADGVTIDCATHTISGIGVGSAINISGASNVVIANCTIINWTDGVSATVADNIIFRDSTVYDCSNSGVLVSDTSSPSISAVKVGDPVCGINITGSSDGTIENGDYYNNTYGVCILDSTGMTVSTNNIINNSQYGVYLRNTNDSFVDGNTVKSNTTLASSIGIYIRDSFNDNVTDNDLVWNSTSSPVTGIEYSLTGDLEDVNIGENDIQMYCSKNDVSCYGIVYDLSDGSDLNSSSISHNDVKLNASYDSIGIYIVPDQHTSVIEVGDFTVSYNNVTVNSSNKGDAVVFVGSEDYEGDYMFSDISIDHNQFDVSTNNDRARGLYVESTQGDYWGWTMADNTADLRSTNEGVSFIWGDAHGGIGWNLEITNNTATGECLNAWGRLIDVDLNQSTVTNNTLTLTVGAGAGALIYDGEVSGWIDFSYNTIVSRGGWAGGPNVLLRAETEVNMTHNSLDVDTSSLIGYGLYFRTGTSGYTLGSGSTFSDNEFHGTATNGLMYGMYFDMDSFGYGSGITIANNTFEVNATSNAIGVYVDVVSASESCKYENWTITNITSFTNSTGAYSVGILVYGSSDYQPSGFIIDSCNTTAITGFASTDPPTAGIGLAYTSNSTISNSIVESTAVGGPAAGVAIVYNSDNNLVTNMTLDSDYGFFTNGTSINNTCLNCTYTSEYVQVGSDMYRKWYVRVRTMDGAMFLTSTNVTTYNSSGLVESKSTGADGWTAWSKLIQYHNVSGSTQAHTPYTFSALRMGYNEANITRTFTTNAEYIINMTSSAKDVTPQGNFNMRSYLIIKNVPSISMVSPDGTIWTCTVDDTGAFECTT